MKLPFKYLVCILLQIPGWLIAQNRLTKQLAEPFTISVIPPSKTMLPEKGTIFGPFELLSLQPTAGKDSSIPVQLQLVAYDTGIFRLSAIMPELVTDTSYLVTIIQPTEQSIREYGQLKEITIPEEDNANPIPWWLIIFTAVILAVACIYFFRRKNKPEPLPVLISEENSKDILFTLKHQWGKQEISSIELGEKLVQALHIHFKVSTKKTISALYKAINRQVHELDKEEVIQCLRLSDAWRFGKQQADQSTGNQTIDSIQKLISQPNAGVKGHTHV